MTGHYPPFSGGILMKFLHYIDRNRLGELLVLKGHISSQDLKFALSRQKHEKASLGQVLIAHNFITPRQLQYALLKQRFLRLTTASILCFMSFGMSAKKVKADYVDDIPARISVVGTNGGLKLASLHSYPALFGSEEKRSTNLKAFTKWIEMFERFEKTMNMPASQKIIQNLQAELRPLQSSSIHDMAVGVNRMMNEKKYILDNKNWGKSDYWATPIEFLARGGDCEDFSIAKYFALRALGVPESHMRIAIVHDNQKNIPHAILIVYAENGPMILDNQIKQAVEASSVSHYRPIFSINREAWWLHTTPETTIVASAR